MWDSCARRENTHTHQDTKSNFRPTIVSGDGDEADADDDDVELPRWNGEQFIASDGHIHDVSDRILIKTETPMNLIKQFDGRLAVVRPDGGVSPLPFNYLKNYDHSECELISTGWHVDHFWPAPFSGCESA